MSTSSTTPPAGLPAAYDTLGPYRLAGLLGEGGMGVVYLGLDRAGRAVAIKALRPHIAGDPDARARLAREVTTLERVQHPRVAAVLDADPEGARPYIVTRYAPGPPLDDYVTAHGPFRGEALLRLARGLHEALGAIHAAGVVHRDLKPGNVLVVDDDPVVIDFGIAHVADDVRLTSTGLVMGTPGYLSPEVLEGAPVTEATDWWGWASTLAYAATGAPPFGRGRVDVILDRVRSGQHDLTGVDERMRPLLAAALAPDPAHRPSAGTVLAALDQLAHGEAPHLATGPSGRTEVLPAVTQTIAPPTESLAARTELAGQQPPRQGSTRVMPAVPLGGAAGGAAGLAAGLAGEGQAGRPLAGASPYAPIRRTPRMAPPASAPPSLAPSRPAASVHPAGQPVAQTFPPAAATTPPGAGGSAYGLEPRQDQRPPVPVGDPRVGKPARTAQLIGLTGAVAALATTWPMIAVGLALVWSVLARTVDRSVTATVLRRHEAGGARGTDVAVAVARSPFQLLAAAVSTLATGLLGILVTVAVMFAVSLGSSLVGVPQAPTGAVPLAVGALVGCWSCWWGAGGVSLRRGSRMLMRGLTPGQLTREIVTALLVAAVLGLGLWALLRHGVPVWWPLQGDPLTGRTVDWQF